VPLSTDQTPEDLQRTCKENYNDLEVLTIHGLGEPLLSEPGLLCGKGGGTQFRPPYEHYRFFYDLKDCRPVIAGPAFHKIFHPFRQAGNLSKTYGARF
jgi:hypothetical protein